MYFVDGIFSSESLCHFHEAKSQSPPPHISVTFLHGRALLAGHVKLQGGVSGWRGQVQASGFVSTNETDSDSEALPWTPNHGLHCCGHHCGRVKVSGRRQEVRAGLEAEGKGTLGTGGKVRGAGRAELRDG